MCVYIYMGTFIKITKKIIVSKHGYILQNHKKKKDIRLNNISKFLRLNLTWIHFKIKEKIMDHISLKMVLKN